MDFDDDGNYGYDIPEDGNTDFKISAIRQRGYCLSNDDSDEHDTRANNAIYSSTDDDVDDNPDFTYGAFGSMKRKHGEAKSKSSGKERSLYGVFYDSDSDDDAAIRRRQKIGGAKHFDIQQNRLAGLAFVKASDTSVAVESKRDESSQNENQEESRSWLNETEQQSLSKHDVQQNSVEGESRAEFIHENDEDEIDVEEITNANERKSKFEELLTLANMTKIPITLSTSRNKIIAQSTKSSDENGGKYNGSSDVNSTNADESITGKMCHGDYKMHGSMISVSNEKGRSGSDFFIKNKSDNMHSQQFIEEPNSNQDSRLEQNQGEMRMGIGSSFVSLPESMDMHFIGSQPGEKGSFSKKTDPSLGKWEKHTKGIGMKLLVKMGYKGAGGLGGKKNRPPVVCTEDIATDHEQNHRNGISAAHDKENVGGVGIRTRNSSGIILQREDIESRGISRPVQVVVRPAGLGLGYGSFKEASQLKTNQQIEAEVRGIDLTETNLTQAKKESPKESDVSILPSTQTLLRKGSSRWRKGKSCKKERPKIVKYQDIIDHKFASQSNKMKIIDMRGPSDTKASQSEKSVHASVPVGEELLRNLSILLHTNENQLCVASYMWKKGQKKIESLEAESAEMVQRRNDILGRIDKMNFALNIIKKSESLFNNVDVSIKDKKVNKMSTLCFLLDSLQTYMSDLFSNFTAEERNSLKFEGIFIPSIVRPPIEIVLSSIDPLCIDEIFTTDLRRSLKKFYDSISGENESYSVRHMIIMKCIIPWIGRSLSSSKWDPIRDVENGLILYELILTLADESVSSLRYEEEIEEDKILKDAINDKVIRGTIFPKIQLALSHWKPQVDNQENMINPIHLWILPWLPYLTNDLIGTMLGDVRQKLRKSISFISKCISNEADFFRSCISLLLPWKKIVGCNAIFTLTSDVVTPVFARSLSRMRIVVSLKQQDWEPLSMLLQYFQEGLMSIDDFASLIEGEVLPAWSYTLYVELKRNSHSIMDFKNFYIAWKIRLLPSTDTLSTNSSHSIYILRSQSLICRYFFGGLKLIQAAFEENQETLDALQPLNPEECNYRISLMHRAKTAKIENESISVLHDTNKMSQRNQNGNKSSFQEVVAEFARHHNIDFRPKMGSNSTKDGKPVFILGDHPVYFENDVIFVLRGRSWQPISLEHLAQTC